MLPTEGFEVIARQPASSDPVKMSAAEVDAFFIARVGPYEKAYDVMCKMKLDELEELQGIADDIRAAGFDDAAQHRGLDWSTLISQIIA